MRMTSCWSAAGIAALLLAAPAGAKDLNGAGGTAIYPVLAKWSDAYKTATGMAINYQAIGSGGGIKQITEKTVDFGASDAPLTDDELAKAPGLLHIPTVLGAVVVAFNVPGVSELKLSPEALAGIFLGKVTKWNDAAIAKDNPAAKLPDLAIAPATRSDGSGTNYVFTDYLAKVSPEFKERVGVGKSVKWPAGLGGKGNEGVTGLVKSTPGAIGYVELAYANQNKLATAALRNRDGSFVKPSIEATSEAAAGVQMPADYRVSITNAPGKGAYPIASFTYLLVYRDQTNKDKGTALINFLRWAVTDGEKFAPALDYAPLPGGLATKVLATIDSMTVQGAKPSASR